MVRPGGGGALPSSWPPEPRSEAAGLTAVCSTQAGDGGGGQSRHHILETGAAPSSKADKVNDSNCAKSKGERPRQRTVKMSKEMSKDDAKPAQRAPKPKQSSCRPFAPPSALTQRTADPSADVGSGAAEEDRTGENAGGSKQDANSGSGGQATAEK
ncbi:unnamed protein product [Diplocarpon coronariae]|uniref:Uncharacterized protein n=1 Tax=Diplocarpon coronariae TaxID=2795749 RepID=A0A218Z9D1_9HELO|nr:hypothetical protein B2J93_362 [Marssonina coronariae]